MDALATLEFDPIADLVTNGATALSFADSDVALRRPLAEVVRATLDAAGKSEHTRRSYETSIALFVAYLEARRGMLIPPDLLPLVEKVCNGARSLVTANTGKKAVSYDYGAAPAAVLRLVDQALLDGFSAWRLTQGDKPNTATIRIYAVRSFLAVALRDGVINQAQAINMGLESYKTRQKRDMKPVGRRLSRDEARALRAAADLQSVKGKRDLAILDFGLFAGLREAEIAGLRMSDFRQDGGKWYLVLTGKGSKTRKLKIHDELYKSFRRWCEAAGLTWHDDRAVFYSVDRWSKISQTPITPTDVSRTVAALGTRAGIASESGAGRLGAHDLRRTFARNAYDNGASLLLVQRMLGHSDPSTTARYIGLDDTNGKSAVDYIEY